MLSPQERLAECMAEAARLRRIIESKSCAEGHTWKSIGGCNASCSDNCSCSIPVNECEVCGDCDYGDNEDARDVIAACDIRRDETARKEGGEEAYPATFKCAPHEEEK